ncbi:hypothetical protein [Aquimarina sp. 433]
MLKKLFIVLFLYISNSALAQQNPITTNDFLGDWSMKKSNEHFPDIYLNKLNKIINYKGHGVSFFIGKYTGKRRIKIFTSKNLPRRCGNDNRLYFSNDFRNQDVWKYDSDTQLLIVFDYKTDQEKKFKVNKISSEELILNRIE